MANPVDTKNLVSLVAQEHIGPDSSGDNIGAKRVANYVWNGVTWERASTNGASSDSPLYVTEPISKKLIDKTTTASVTYIGEAVLGTATASALWRIKKIDQTVSGFVTITWSSATAIWDNRATSVVYT